MSVALQEFTAASAAHLRVDRDAGVLRSVKLLGFTSSNGRRYLESALREAVPLYEGAKVNVNHAKEGPVGPREYQDRLGVIRNVTLREGEGLFGDLHYNPKHALAEQLVWDAEHAPQNVGLSHNVLAHTASRNGAGGGETIVERIEKVQSVDVVADPATTRGLFEATDPREGQPPISRPAEIPPPSNPAQPPVQAAVEGADAAAHAARARLICTLLHEHDLPLPGDESQAAERIVSESFFDSLWKAPTDAVLRQLIEDRAALVKAAQEWGQPPTGPGAAPLCRHAEHGATLPTSRDQFAATLGAPTVPGAISAETLAEAIKAQ